LFSLSRFIPWRSGSAKARSEARTNAILSSWQYEATVAALACAIELREDERGDHTERVADLAMLLAQEVAPELAVDPRLRLGFLLHDIGKIGVPDAILLKPGPLTRSEWRRMEQHTVLGEHLVSNIPYLREVARDVILHHHEKWDGSGYPWGLAGEEIPLSARIFALADGYDAMINDRPYRAAMEPAEALDRIIAASGAHFDPRLVWQFGVVLARSADEGRSWAQGPSDRIDAGLQQRADTVLEMEPEILAMDAL